MVIFFVLSALFLLALLLSLYTYRVCFHSPAKRVNDPYQPLTGEQYEAVADNMFAVTKIMENGLFESVSVTSKDGLRLYGRYYHKHDGAPVQILFHGYRSLALRDCAGGYILADKMGFNILAVDQRSHAQSEGRAITFGICERYDCVAWTEYISQRFGRHTPIVLSGLSMGAATVLMASELDLPENVVCIIADSPYSSPKAIIRKVCRDRHLPDWLAYPFIRIGAKLFGGFSIEECSAEDAVRNARIPILLIHGEDDRFVPCRMSKRIFRACSSPARLHTFPDAGHGLCYMSDPLRYEKIIIHFLLEIPELKDYLTKNSYVQRELSGKTLFSE